MSKTLTIADYPLAETRGSEIKGPRGKPLDDITLDSVLSGEAQMEDLRITPQALSDQAEIARAAGRATLGSNFERAGELVNVPQDLIMQTYELLRPGRAKSKQELLDLAQLYADTYKAPRLATFLREATEIYERRGLFVHRF